MVKPLLRLLPLAILIVALGAHAQTLPALDATARNWRDALNPWAQTVSLRFSIECDGRGITVARSPSPLQSRTVHPPAAVENAHALLALVREWLPEAELQRDDQRKELVHIVEKSLSGIPDYVLNQKTSLNFAGTLDDLLNELEKQSQGRLARSRTGVTPMPPRHYDARVNIHASNQTYRDNLSTALANADQPPIEWQATTVENQGKLTTYIEFYWNLRPPPQPATGPAELRLVPNAINPSDFRIER